jgi:hypothetical protein
MSASRRSVPERDGNRRIIPVRHAALIFREGEAVDGFAFEGFVRVEVLTGGVDVAMAHQLLHGDDIAAALKLTA